MPSTSNTNTYVEQGNSLVYNFEIKNIGSTEAKNVTLEDTIPDGLIASGTKCTIGKLTKTDYVTQSGKITVSSDLPAGETMYVTLDTVVDSLDGLKEKTIENYGSVSADNLDSKNSNKITHILIFFTKFFKLL